MADQIDNTDYLSIKHWAEDDQPREKLIKKGRGALSNAELIAILLGTGYRNESAVDVAKKLLNQSSNDLNNLAQLSLTDLVKIKGIGTAKAVSVAAALELGRRRKAVGINSSNPIQSSKDAYQHLFPALGDLPHEEFHILLLNRANKPIECYQISSGGVSGTVADVRMIYKRAIEKLASALIVGHNHPSGSLKPSQADIRLTEKLKESGKLLDIPLLDHIIAAGNDYFSFADEGLI